MRAIVLAQTWRLAARSLRLFSPAAADTAREAAEAAPVDDLEISSSSIWSGTLSKSPSVARRIMSPSSTLNS